MAIAFSSEKPELSFSLDGKVNVTFKAHKGLLQALSALDGQIDVEVKKHRKKRSLDANAYMWLLLGEIADKLNSSKDEVYLTMLDRYGVYTHLIVKPNAVERIMQEWRTVRNLGEVTVNGTTGIQLQCYFGSSAYDTKEMSRLIDGVVYEAKELGIDTRTPEELSLMKEEWGR